MSTALRTIEFLCLGVWIGGICLLSFVVAPGAFSLLGSQDLAATMVRFTLSRLHFIGMSAGVVYLVVHFMRSNSVASMMRAALVLVALMILLTAVSQFYVSAHMADLRHEMGSVEHASATSPAHVEFERYHQYSVWLEGAVLLLGLAAMYFTARGEG
jgi:hypothetical protein